MYNVAEAATQATLLHEQGRDEVLDVSDLTVNIQSLPEDVQDQTLAVLQERMVRGSIVHTSARLGRCEESSGVKLSDEGIPFYRKLMDKYLSVVTWLPRTTMASLRADIVAGITVAVMVIPQGMSYANIAGTDYIYGLYSAAVPPFFYAFFGNSKQLAVGPTAMVSLLVEAGLSTAVECDFEPANEFCKDTYTSYAVLTSLVMGVFQILSCLLGFGFIISFMGHPVASGFTSGAAIIIGLSQVKYIVGYDIPRTSRVHETIEGLIDNIDGLSWITLLLGFVWIGYLIGNRKLATRFKKQLGWMLPLGPLISSGVGILLIFLVTPLRDDDLDVQYIGDIPSGIFPVSVSDWKFENIPKVIPTALSATLIGFMESIAISKHLAALNGYEIEAGQELFALGMSNIAGSFFSCFPVTGSFSRSAVSYQCGAVTQLSGIITALVMLLTLLFLTPLFYYLPKFALAAIVITSVIPLVAFQQAIRLWRIKKIDFGLWVISFLGVLFIGVLEGIFIAVILSLVVVIYESARPQMVILWRIPGTAMYRNMKQETSGAFVPNVLILRIGASMYFANAAYIKETLLQYEKDLREVNPVEYVVLEMTAIVTLDSTAIQVIQDIVAHFRSRGIGVAFAMVGRRVEATMARANMKQEIGAHWFLPTVDEAVQYCLCRQYKKNKDSAKEDLQAAIPRLPSITLKDEIGFSNDVHFAHSAVFVQMSGEPAEVMGKIMTCFNLCGMTMMRAEMETVLDTMKHTFLVKSAAHEGKLFPNEKDLLMKKISDVMFSKVNMQEEVQTEAKTDEEAEDNPKMESNDV
uniref:STAS domain-containing protein n=1 Tax=Noctiluca scintillans TaxID=2966 RepID=A0A7S1AG56_NOCSC|mmetsp:Transcript_44968/g.119203  ORF Transcript_44968/g.119203 Transcript_44968/m.119203 type:complete len:805 (+) Transcript_44968:41-2455(+)